MLGHKAVARRPAEKKCGQEQQRPLWSVKPVEFSRCGNRRAVAFKLEERYEEGEGFLARKKYKHLGDYWMGRDEICCCYLLWEKTEGAEKYNWLEKKGICYTPYHKRLSMAVYQLWSPRTPLDESFQWLRHTTPKPSSKHPFRASPCFPHTPSDLEVQLCFQEVTLVLDTPFLEPGVSPKLPCHTSELRTMNKKGLVRKPQPVRLSGLDSVFGRVITA